MELLNPAFVILLIKITICVIPVIVAIYLLRLSAEEKRKFRNTFCNRLLGVSDAIPFPNFERMLLVTAILSLLFAGTAAWFLLLSGMLTG